MKTEKFVLTDTEKNDVINGLNPFETETFKNAVYAMLKNGGLGHLNYFGENENIYFNVSYLEKTDNFHPLLPEEVTSAIFDHSISLEFMDMSYQMLKEQYVMFYNSQRKSKKRKMPPKS